MQTLARTGEFGWSPKHKNEVLTRMKSESIKSVKLKCEKMKSARKKSEKVKTAYELQSKKICFAASRFN